MDMATEHSRSPMECTLKWFFTLETRLVRSIEHHVRTRKKKKSYQITLTEGTRLAAAFTR